MNLPFLKVGYAERLNAVKTDRYALLSALVCALLLILIIYSFYVRVRMYMLGITLWADEAKLVENIVDRTMGEMLTPPLVNRQTAPVLYLIVVKAFTLLFGASEAVLRAPSFIAMIGMLIVQWFLMRKVFGVRILYTLFSVALSSTFLYYMQHSNELKSYIGDAMFVLCVLLGYYIYREGILGRGVRAALLFALILIVCMLFSTPAAFAVGAVIIVEFVVKCIRRDKKALLLIVLCGVVFIAAFAINYILWLKPIATDEGMIDYWSGFKFSFLIFQREALAHNYALFKDLLAPIWQTIWVTLPFAVAGFVISLTRRNVYSLAVGVFFLLLLVASAIDKYPISNRLWLFLYVIIFIYAFVFIDALRLSLKDGGGARAARAIIPLFFAFLLLAPNFSFPAFGKGEEWTLTPGDQAKPLIEYVRENIKEGETLYSYESANVILKYENGYHTNRIGNVSGDNIIFGSDEHDDDIAVIDGLGSAYVLFYHSYTPLSGDWLVDYMIEQLQRRGYMDVVMDVYHTPLYWYTNDLAKVRASASYGLTVLEAGGGRLVGVLHIENTGGTILAHDRFEDYGPLYVLLRGTGEEEQLGGAIGGVALEKVTSPIRPGEGVDLWIEIDGLEPGEYEIELVAFRQYAFSELGAPAINVTIDS